MTSNSQYLQMDALLKHVENHFNVPAADTAAFYRDFVAASSLYQAGDFDALILKLASEAGEVAGKMGKAHRGDYNDANGTLDETALYYDLMMELGDVVWYMQALCNALDISLNDLMVLNMRKLVARAERGTLQGSGDNR